jgi:hypothetical protein
MGQGAVRHSDIESQTQTYFSRIEPEMQERFAMSRDLDNARNEMWKGANLDFPDAPVAIRFLPLTPRAPSQRAIRRFVESGYAAVFDDDIDLQERVEVLFANALKSGPPLKSGPDRETLLNSIREQTGKKN